MPPKKKTASAGTKTSSSARSAGNKKGSSRQAKSSKVTAKTEKPKAKKPAPGGKKAKEASAAKGRSKSSSKKKKNTTGAKKKKKSAPKEKSSTRRTKTRVEKQTTVKASEKKGEKEMETGIIFLPSLNKRLLLAEDHKGSPLTLEEITLVRNEAATMVVPLALAERKNRQEGFTDLEPDNLWYQWQMLRRDLDRNPPLDPGPNTGEVETSNQKYQDDAQFARDSLVHLMSVVMVEEVHQGAVAGQNGFCPMIKVLIQDKDKKKGEKGGLIWLADPRPCLKRHEKGQKKTPSSSKRNRDDSDDNDDSQPATEFSSFKRLDMPFLSKVSSGEFALWTAKVFEEVPHLPQHPAGTMVVFHVDQVHDWMVNVRGTLYGGLSMRGARKDLPTQEAKEEWDENYGITKFACLHGQDGSSSDDGVEEQEEEEEENDDDDDDDDDDE